MTLTEAEVHLSNLSIMSLGQLADQFHEYGEICRKCQKLMQSGTMTEPDYENGQQANKMINVINAIVLFKYGMQFQWVTVTS